MLFAQIAEGDEVHVEVFCSAFRAKFSPYGSENVDALRTEAYIFRILFSPAIAAECVKNG